MITMPSAHCEEVANYKLEILYRSRYKTEKLYFSCYHKYVSKYSLKKKNYQIYFYPSNVKGKVWDGWCHISHRF